MFWPPPRHNKQRDRRKRLDSCYWVPHLSFKQKTSSLDSAFSRKSACKLLTFHWIFRSRFAPRFDLENLKKKSTPEKSIFSTHSEKSLLDPEPVGGLFKTKKVRQLGKSVQLGTCGIRENPLSQNVLDDYFYCFLMVYCFLGFRT